MRDFQGWVLHLFWQKDLLDDVGLLLVNFIIVYLGPQKSSATPPLWGTCQTCISWNASPVTVNIHNPGGDW